MSLKGIIEIVVTIAVALAFALLVQAFLIKPYQIPSRSMVPTLSVGQRILTNRLVDHPSLGDIVVFHPPVGANNSFRPAVCGAPNQGESPNGTYFPRACDQPTPQEWSSQTFVKRVVGLPGDEISIVNGHVIRNGVQEKDAYINPCGGSLACNFRQTIKIPPGHYFMMGDNRGDSDDSRYWGPIPASWVIGVAFFTYWPPDRVGTL